MYWPSIGTGACLAKRSLCDSMLKCTETAGLAFSIFPFCKGEGSTVYFKVFQKGGGLACTVAENPSNS